MERIYLAERVRRTLATDPRVGHIDLEVQFSPTGRGVVTGCVDGSSEREAIDEALRSVPGAEDFLNRTHLRKLAAPAPPEAIPRPGSPR